MCLFVSFVSFVSFVKKNVCLNNQSYIAWITSGVAQCEASAVKIVRLMKIKPTQPAQLELRSEVGWGWQKKIWVKLCTVNKICVRKVFGKKRSDRIKPKGRMHDPPPTPTQKIIGLNLCWVVVSFVRWGHIKNFRPLGPLLLVEVEFLGVGWWGGGVGGMNSNNHVKPNFRLS